MADWLLGTTPHAVTPGMRRRHRFTVLVVFASVLLLSWGGLVTSIDAGLAVPDWPASFGSYDPLRTGFEDPNDPSAQWWHRLPILAEHGHRLIAALVGLLTIALTVWTWRADPRSWMRKLGWMALGLVIFQGVLGGLRVVWVSLDLAVVHACIAQVFFSLLVAMALFTSPGWLQADSVPAPSPATRQLRRRTVLTVAMLYVQIVLGALLRHAGTGVDPLFVGIHLLGAFAVFGLVLATFLVVQLHFRYAPLLRRGAWLMLGAVLVQIMLGFSAYLVLLRETSLGLRSAVQITLNTSHLLVGALLMASAVSLALLSLRRPATITVPNLSPAAS